MIHGGESQVNEVLEVESERLEVSEGKEKGFNAEGAPTSQADVGAGAGRKGHGERREKSRSLVRLQRTRDDSL